MDERTPRVGQIQEAMRDARLDAVVLRLPENVLLTTGWFARYSGTALVVVPPAGAAVLLVPEHEVSEAAESWGGTVAALPDGDVGRALARVAAELGAAGGSIGYEGSFESIAPPSFFGEPNAVAGPTQRLIRTSFATDGLVDVTEALEAIRSVKTTHELELIRRTNEIAMLGLEAFRRAAVPGATEVEVMAAVEHAIAVQGHGYKGARWVRGFATVWSGPRLVDGWQYFRSDPRTIERDDVVMVELGTVADGYWSDHTRTVVAGRASAAVAEAYAAVQAALASALAAARPGATGGEVDAVARATCAERGLTQFPHHTGHGTGYRYHESLPALEPGSTDVLRAGQVVAVEPGIYGSELAAGVRHEDDAVVTSEGAVVLATTAYGLDLE